MNKLIINKFAKKRHTMPKELTNDISKIVNYTLAASVQIVVYCSSILEETGDNDLPVVKGNFEVVSINASPVPEGQIEPMTPETLMHNHFGSDGGTDTLMDDELFVKMLRKSFEYWKDKTQTGLSFFVGTEEAVLKIVQDNFSKSQEGYREGVVLVNVPPISEDLAFYTNVVTLTEGDKLVGEFKSRHKDEKPRKFIMRG